MVGRKKERQVLADIAASQESEFLVVYGRRRVGKTFLIREYFNDRFAFYATGVASTKTHEQLGYFHESLSMYGSRETVAPKNWKEAFSRLREILSDEDCYRDPVSGKRVIFLDELPWMDTARSDFKTALDYFWNSYGSAQKDILLIVCGSATSWIIRNILSDHGGFYNRVTGQMHLMPFSLKECEEYCITSGVAFSRQDLIESYMVFGGIPYYFHMLDRRLSLPQNIDELCFKKSGALYYEYDRLFRSLYKNADKHLSIMGTLSERAYGKTRTEILDSVRDISDGEKLTRVLEELEQCGFIRKYHNFSKKENGHYFQVIDPFSLFHLRFLKERKFESWLKYIRTPAYYSWSGYAFEMVCINHIDRIKAALGISGVETTEYTWASRKAGNGAQIDLLIDREDNVINVCEMKYSRSPFSIDQKYEHELENKMDVFAAETGSKKSLHLTMICAAGLVHNKHSGMVLNEIDGDDLFGGWFSEIRFQKSPYPVLTNKYE